MSLSEWDTDFSTEIPHLNAGFRALIEVIGSLRAKVQSGDYGSNIVDGFQDLYLSATKRFAHEEAVMRANHYDGYKEHQTEHQSLLDEINRVMSECLQGLGNEAVMIERLYSSFYSHFMTQDARLHRSSEKT